jgi:hypothetical protein
MAVTEHSDLSYYRGLSLVQLGRAGDARALFEAMKAFANRERMRDAKIDYFATSLPLLLVFEDDLEASKNGRADRLLDLADKGLDLVNHSMNHLTDLPASNS